MKINLPVKEKQIDHFRFSSKEKKIELKLQEKNSLKKNEIKNNEETKMQKSERFLKKHEVLSSRNKDENYINKENEKNYKSVQTNKQNDENSDKKMQKLQKEIEEKAKEVTPFYIIKI